MPPFASRSPLNSLPSLSSLPGLGSLLPAAMRSSQPVPTVTDVPTVRDDPALPRLIAQLETCEADTLRLLGPTYVRRLQHWRKYAGDEAKLVAFVRDLLFRTSVNGWALHQKGGLSLEAIAIGMGAPTFAQRDVDHARETLGLAARATPVG